MERDVEGKEGGWAVVRRGVVCVRPSDVRVAQPSCRLGSGERRERQIDFPRARDWGYFGICSLFFLCPTSRVGIPRLAQVLQNCHNHAAPVAPVTRESITTNVLVSSFEVCSSKHFPLLLDQLTKIPRFGLLIHALYGCVLCQWADALSW